MPVLSPKPETALQSTEKRQLRSSVEDYFEMNKMISTKKLIQMARKWQKMATMGRRRITFRRTNSKSSSANAKGSSAAQKGRFVVYTMDERRLAIPLSYLSNNIVRELFRVSEEEFGIPQDHASH
ncbi:uncharacterized protein J3R85_002416 [Psidium guajava]|nr:uncharacterized protein J3R85_002416 [Psidium guajava]